MVPCDCHTTKSSKEFHEVYKSRPSTTLNKHSKLHYDELLNPLMDLSYDLLRSSFPGVLPEEQQRKDRFEWPSGVMLVTFMLCQKLTSIQEIKS